MPTTPSRAARAIVAAAAALALAACAAPPTPAPSPEPTVTATPTATPEAEPRGVAPVGAVTDVATGLAAPWSMLRISNDVTLVSQRDDGRILALIAGRRTRDLGTLPGVYHERESGLLGLALSPDERYLYAYLTTRADNRIVRMTWNGVDAPLGDVEVILAGIPRAPTHNGGRIAFGPDGMLYATVGDVRNLAAPQDPTSLSGKILRMTPEGTPPADNPDPSTLVYSMGHRNPQGLTWDRDGQLWAAEFGQDTWDEFNRIEPGGNYGWPIIEGVGGDPRFLDPVVQWPTSEASPSGLTYVDGTFFLACLRGKRVWAIQVAPDGTAEATPWFVQQFGRIRDVTAGPDGTLWMLTNNTDGGGDPRAGDDRILRVSLAPLEDD